MGQTHELSCDAAFTRGTPHAMGMQWAQSTLVLPAAPSKLGCMRDGHGTTCRCLCVNGGCLTGIMESNRGTFLRSKWNSLELFLTNIIFPGTKKCRYFFICPYLCWPLIACLTSWHYCEKSVTVSQKRNLPYFINDGCYHGGRRVHCMPFCLVM